MVEHKGLQYQVAETANRSGWTWTVQMPDGHTKTGVSCSRGHAIFYAINAIEMNLKCAT
jgi:hypothetical protein